jgi:hypothetical protein
MEGREKPNEELEGSYLDLDKGENMTDDEALVEKQRTLSEAAVKSVSMTPLAEIIAKRLGRIPAKPAKYVPAPSDIPIWPGFKQRRFLIRKGTDNGKATVLTVVWIDDDGTCTKDFGPGMRRCHTLEDEGFIEPKGWHNYRIISKFRKENIFAFMCPASLTFEEKRDKVEVDDPPGRWESRVREMRERLSEKKNKGAEPMNDEVPF